MKKLAAAAAVLLLAGAAILTGCGRKQQTEVEAATAVDRALQGVNNARFTDPKTALLKGEQGYSPVIAKLQVLLDRAHFSPGSIDGHFNENTQAALRAFEKAASLPVDGVLDRDVWARLTAADQKPVVSTYVIDPLDVAGPFIRFVPPNLMAMAQLDSLSYRNPEEALAEQFHMSPALLKALNPDADFGKSGSRIVVADKGSDDLGVDIALLEIDRAGREVRAFAADQRLLAVYPATVGSHKRPAPVGGTAVKSVDPQPTYRYDDDTVAYGKGLELGPSEIAPGPNNPVGSVWIELAFKAYGVHGTPDPEDVGKPTDRGGVRLTNWDARELARGVREGTPVVFR